MERELCGLAPGGVRTRTAGRRRCAAWLAALFSLCATLAWTSTAHAYADRTYDIIVRAYCAPGTSCGHPDDAALEQFMRDQMRLLNAAWRPAHVSFRIRSVVVTRESTYSSITGVEDVDDVGTTDGARVRQLRLIAAGDPDAITLFILPNLTYCWSAIPAVGWSPAYPEMINSIFCAPFGDASVLIHEIGHHFCLSHTFTFQDPADNSPVSHEGDGFSDTPPDPGLLEDDASVAGFDKNGSGALVNGHEWCDFATSAAVDPGSPYGQFCSPTCRLRSGGATTTTAFAPNTALAMSYYKHACIGPYVVGGERTEAFSPQGIQAIRACIADVPGRVAYANVCAARGGDIDNDGVCGSDDQCPGVYDATSVDADSDGVPDACDNCIIVANADQLDTDSDGSGDACDPDIDNDGCPNGEDQHPDQARVPAGTFLHPGCSASSSTRMAFEGADTDGDGVLDCHVTSTDDDDDGEPDDTDACPTIAGTDPFLCTFPGIECPPMPIHDCGPLCGLQFNLWLVSVVNPADRFALDRFWFVDDTLFVSGIAGLTRSETVMTLAGRGAFGPLTGNLAFEVQDVAGGETVRLFEYSSDDVDATDFERGPVAAFRWADGYFDVTGAWGLGVPLSAPLADRDLDEIPDIADLCAAVADPLQRDSDGDGFGDACDPDFDQSGVVDAAELVFVRACEGVDTTLRANYGEPGLPSLGGALPEPEELAEAIRCRAADMNGDGVVDGADSERALELVGLPPGPSGRSVPPSPPDPDPDPGVEPVPDAGGGDAGDAGPDTSDADDVGADGGDDLGRADGDHDVAPVDDALADADGGDVGAGLPLGAGGDEGCQCAASEARRGPPLVVWLAALALLSSGRRRRSEAV